MSNETIQRNSEAVTPLDTQWRQMNAALEKLGRRVVIPPIPAQRTGRLIVALDLTGSRAESLNQARKATAAMFAAIRSIGTVAVKLAYYRGSSECRAGAWHDDAERVCRSMLSLSCESGETQIARVLRLALAEPETLSGIVFIGDHCEERPEELLVLAETLGTRSLPLFIFHECADRDAWSLQAKPLFQRMAKLSGGVYVEFRPDSGEVLKELLSNIAALSAGGTQAVERMAMPASLAARQLRGSLLALPASTGK